jgi:hypothetical protein
VCSHHFPKAGVWSSANIFDQVLYRINRYTLDYRVFYLLRLIGSRRIESFLSGLVALSSSAWMFWFVVPETYGFGSLTILFAALIVILANRRSLPGYWFLASSVLTLSITLTNWMAGIFTSFISLPWKKRRCGCHVKRCVM